MRFLGIAIFIFIASLFTAVNRTVAAETISTSKTITVQAKVLPTIYIVTDKTGSIIEISSNSNQNVAPIVFTDKIAQGNQINLSDDVFKQYEYLMAGKQIKAGIVYKKLSPQKQQLPPPSYSLFISLNFS